VGTACNILNHLEEDLEKIEAEMLAKGEEGRRRNDEE
jgi:hypothetical protein